MKIHVPVVIYIYFFNIQKVLYQIKVLFLIITSQSQHFKTSVTGIMISVNGNALNTNTVLLYSILKKLMKCNFIIKNV